MKKIVIGIVGFLVFLVIIALISITSIWSHRNTVIALKESIDSQYTTNKSSYDNMWKSFKETAQATDMQAKDFKKTYDQMISGRYENDKNLLVKAVQEQNPSLNGQVYSNLQQQVEAGRASFQNNQKAISDLIREYNVAIQKYVVMNAIFHFEKLDSKDFVVTSEKTEHAFETGKDDEIKLRDN